MENVDDRPPGQSDRHGVGQEEKEEDEGHPGGQPPLHHPLEIEQLVQTSKFHLTVLIGTNWPGALNAE